MHKQSFTKTGPAMPSNNTSTYSQPTYDSVVVGDELPSIEKRPMRINLVQYAAGSGDFNPLHYDADFPQAQALGGNIVHGRMKYASLGECVSNWLQHGGTIVALGCQYRGMDTFGHTFTVKGKVTGKRQEDGHNLVDLEVWTQTADGKVTTPGKATVRLDN
jgi:acyl dehydratase